MSRTRAQRAAHRLVEARLVPEFAGELRPGDEHDLRANHVELEDRPQLFGVGVEAGDRRVAVERQRMAEYGRARRLRNGAGGLGGFRGARARSTVKVTPARLASRSANFTPSAAPGGDAAGDGRVLDQRQRASEIIFDVEP